MIRLQVRALEKYVFGIWILSNHAMNPEMLIFQERMHHYIYHFTKTVWQDGAKHTRLR